jgi:hypothetical protein
MQGRHEEKSRGAAVLFLLVFTLIGTASTQKLYDPQDNFHLHAKLAGRSYRDDKIEVRAPGDWSIAIGTVTTTGSSEVTFARGAVLRKGKYILQLCTGCGQASGIAGGRFSEIAGMVQPWYREDSGARPSPCGKQETSKASDLLDRVDFWYQRDPVHIFNKDADDCREPRTTATVWYGSYFEEHCPPGAVTVDCGGYFLEHTRLTGQRDADYPDQMAFALTYDTTDPDALPRKGDPELNQALREATAIVRSVRYHRRP